MALFSMDTDLPGTDEMLREWEEPKKRPFDAFFQESRDWSGIEAIDGPPHKRQRGKQASTDMLSPLISPFDADTVCNNNNNNTNDDDNDEGSASQEDGDREPADATPGVESVLTGAAGALAGTGRSEVETQCIEPTLAGMPEEVLRRILSVHASAAPGEPPVPLLANRDVLAVARASRRLNAVTHEMCESIRKERDERSIFAVLLNLLGWLVLDSQCVEVSIVTDSGTPSEQRLRVVRPADSFKLLCTLDAPVNTVDLALSESHDVATKTMYAPCTRATRMPNGRGSMTVDNVSCLANDPGIVGAVYDRWMAAVRDTRSVPGVSTVISPSDSLEYPDARVFFKLAADAADDPGDEVAMRPLMLLAAESERDWVRPGPHEWCSVPVGQLWHRWCTTAEPMHAAMAYMQCVGKDPKRRFKPRS